MRTFTNALRTSFLAALSFALCAPPCAIAKDKPGSQYFVYYGMYTGPKSKGVMVSRFDSGARANSRRQDWRPRLSILHG